MAKKLQLQVPTPCHENWENMTPTQKGRFCASCQKQVIDFSNKSDREIAMFFKKSSTGSVCGRFLDDQLNRDIDIPKKRIPWLKYFFQFLIPAFFISYRATAQGKVKVVPNTTTQPSKPSKLSQQKKLREKVVSCLQIVGDTSVRYAPKNEIDTVSKTPQIVDTPEPVILGKIAISLESFNLITGKVIDDAGKPVPFATVAIKGTKIGVAADSMGRFDIKPKSGWNNVTLSISCVGFAPSEKNIKWRDFGNDVEIRLHQTGTLGEIVLTSSNQSFRKGTVCGTTIVRSYGNAISKKTSANYFRIYPNPVRSNSTLNIEWKQNEFGDHQLQLFNQSGQLVFSKEITITEGAKSVSVNLPSIISGKYFLKLSSKEFGKSYTEKLVVE